MLNGKVCPGDIVAIIGAGPIGLATLLTAQFYSPAEIIMVDLDAHRLEVAKRLGATQTIDGAKGRAAETVMEVAGGRGVDVAIEAVGASSTFELCQAIVAPGGVIANIGVHGKSAELHLERLWAQNITLTTRLVDTVTTPLLMKTVIAGRLRPRDLITQRYELAEIMGAYETFSRASENRALKVLIANADGH